MTTPKLPDMDIEEEMRVLLLESAEDNGVVGVEGPEEELGHVEKTEENLVGPHRSAESIQLEPKEFEASHQSPSVQGEPKAAEAAVQEDNEALDNAEDGNKKHHLNVVFIGHVDAGKSTTGGQILFLSRQLDDRTIQKYETEAKDKSRESWYDEIEEKLIPFLRSSGYSVKKDVQFLPISGLVGTNIKSTMEKNICSWWNGPCLFEIMYALEVPLRDPNGPFRMPIIDKFKGMGTVVMGKVESGSVQEGDALIVRPNKVHVKVLAVYCDENKVRHAGPGENL